MHDREVVADPDCDFLCRRYIGVAAGLVAASATAAFAADITAAIAQTTIDTRLIGMPSSDARSPFSAEARTAMPMSVYLKNAPRPMQMAMVTTAATIHLAAATNNFAQLEYQHRLAEAYPADLFPRMPLLIGDCFPLPTAPGLGVEFNEEAVADHPFEPWEAPHWRRRDGAYTNW